MDGWKGLGLVSHRRQKFCPRDASHRQALDGSRSLGPSSRFEAEALRLVPDADAWIEGDIRRQTASLGARVMRREPSPERCLDVFIAFQSL
jgi:hypothetical protein